MKSTLIVASAIVIVFSAAAQEYTYFPFPENNAIWSEYYWTSESPAVYNKYALFNEDTIINNRVYQKVFHTVNRSSIIQGNSMYIGGIREDSLKRVFATGSVGWFGNPEIIEILLYDFSLNEGDTLWNYTSNTVTANFTADFLVVEDIDTMLIQNTTRKVFSFYNYPWTRWIEGIGNIQGLFFPSGDLTTGGDNSKLICMHQNDSLMYFNEEFESCVPHFVIDNVVLLPNNEIKVYPNPVTQGSVIFENLHSEFLELFDAEGRIVQKKDVKGSTRIVLNTAHLPPGSYTYRLVSTGLIPTKGKLVIK